MLKIFLKRLLVTVMALPMIQCGNKGGTDINPTAGECGSSQVSYEEAVSLLNSGEVESVGQDHSLCVSLVLSDGSTVVAKETNIDDIFDAVDACGEPCQDINLVTE